jgi:hypothetical protein
MIQCQWGGELYHTAESILANELFIIPLNSNEKIIVYAESIYGIVVVDRRNEDWYKRLYAMQSKQGVEDENNN